METNNKPDPKFHIRDAGSVLIALAQRLYAAYTENSGNLNYRGEQCPAWDALGEAVQSHWCATALDAMKACDDDPVLSGVRFKPGKPLGPAPTMVAKFFVETAVRNAGDDGSIASVQLGFRAAYGEGNEMWSQMTPAGEIRMTITNPALFYPFETDQRYLVHFTKAE